jgi:starch phosphorylase
MISGDGWQQEFYPTYDPAKLPIKPVTDRHGKPVVCTVNIDQPSLHRLTVAVGRAKVVLLDTDLTENDQRYRDLTAHVYGGDQANRIGQEMILGIGGVRMLRAMGIKPAVFHMNEGHSAFLTLELLREQLAARKPLNKAEEAARQHCVFTTHTPVAAGHDRFDKGLMDWALKGYASTLGITIDQLTNYGRVKPDDQNETFAMTVLALRMSRGANAVSELHGRVSRDMWKGLHPDTPVDRVPIGHITNGIHTPGWNHTPYHNSTTGFDHSDQDCMINIFGKRFLIRKGSPMKNSGTSGRF